MGEKIRGGGGLMALCEGWGDPGVGGGNYAMNCTGGVQIIGRNSRFFRYFVTKTKKNREKNYRRFKVNSGSIRQYTFCLEIQSIN